MGENENRYVLDPNTGEVLTEIHPGDRLLRAETIDYLHNPGREFNKGKTFVKLYDEVIPYLINCLTTGELKYVIALARHVSYKDCVVRRTNNNLSEPISAKDFNDINNFSYSTTKRIFNSLKNKGVVAYVEVGQVFSDYIGKANTMYLVNPYVYFRGMDINETVKAIFDNSGWKEELDKYRYKKVQDDSDLKIE